jgi:hypothetical protein
VKGKDHLESKDCMGDIIKMGLYDLGYGDVVLIHLTHGKGQ